MYVIKTKHKIKKSNFMNNRQFSAKYLGSTGIGAAKYPWPDPIPANLPTLPECAPAAMTKIAYLILRTSPSLHLTYKIFISLYKFKHTYTCTDYTLEKMCYTFFLTLSVQYVFQL